MIINNASYHWIGDLYIYIKKCVKLSLTETQQALVLFFEGPIA